jgi:hypothetical protein
MQLPWQMADAYEKTPKLAVESAIENDPVNYESSRLE